MVGHPPRAFPLGEAPPVGTRQSTAKHGCSTRGRRPRPRKCLRKGCGRQYQPRSWNQRYCQEPECRREVNRWLAARRQARHRQHAEVKVQHARAEKERRQRAKSTSQTVGNPELTPARGHAAEIFFPPRSAIGRAATRTPRTRPATPHATAATSAGKLFAMSRTVNASGSLAAPGMGGRSAPSSTKPHAGAGVLATDTSPARNPRGHLLSARVS
jgi:hypothetical protein